MFFVALSFLGAAPAMASKRQAQERAARKACLNGDPNKGVAILSELFLDTKNPTYIFNQARCYEQNGRYADAVVRFEEFLRTADANSSPEDRAAAEKHLADCQEKVARGHSPASTQPPPPPVPLIPSTSASEPAAAPTPAALTVMDNASPPPPTHGRGLLIAGITTGVVGVAAIAGGVVMALKANSLADKMENDVGGYSTGRENDRKTYKTLSWVGYGVGAACVATGAVLLGFGISSRARTGAETPTVVALVPAWGPGHMGAVFKGEF